MTITALLDERRDRDVEADQLRIRLAALDPGRRTDYERLLGLYELALEQRNRIERRIACELTRRHRSAA